jgi:hypothetical protein
MPSAARDWLGAARARIRPSATVARYGAGATRAAERSLNGDQPNGRSVVRASACGWFPRHRDVLYRHMTVDAFSHHASFSGTAIRRNEAAPRERDAIVSNRVSNGRVMPDGQAKVARNHNPRVGGSSPSSGIL